MILVFGATGFTGRLIVDQLVEQGLPVRIAGRSQERLEALAQRHGGLEWAQADVDDPASLDAACEGVSVLATSVGPYSWWGHVAAEAAIRNKVAYIDTTGEPPFVRRIFDEWGPQAAAVGVPMLTAFGYDYVPGHLAAGIALDRAGEQATRVDVGYFMGGKPSRSPKRFSAGTLKSLQASAAAPQFAFRDGKLVDERGAKHVYSFAMNGGVKTAISIGATEHLFLPRSFPQLQTVNVGLGWFGDASRAIGVLSAVGEALEKLPGASRLLAAATGAGKNSRRSHGDAAAAGPSESVQAEATTNVIAVAFDAAGEELARARVIGPNPYPLTGASVAWAARKIDAGEVDGVGALGPVEAFGLEALVAGCAEFGLKEAQ